MYISLSIGTAVSIRFSFDSIFPSGILIGKVNSINSEVNSNFYDIDILSSQNFYNLSKVYVINNPDYEEKKNFINTSNIPTGETKSFKKGFVFIIALILLLLLPLLSGCVKIENTIDLQVYNIKCK